MDRIKLVINHVYDFVSEGDLQQADNATAANRACTTGHGQETTFWVG